MARVRMRSRPKARPRVGSISASGAAQIPPAMRRPSSSRSSTRFAGQNAAALKASLEANGFACEESGRLDCRIEIMERQCAYDWYVVLERGRAEPVAGFDQMCLGAR